MSIQKTEQPTRARYSALVRGEDGNLSIRRFESAALATQAARGRDLQPVRHSPLVTANDKRPHWTVAKLAKALGITPRAVHLRCDRGELPNIDHGTELRSRRVIPAWIAELAITDGLRAVAARARAGVLTPSSRS